MTDPVAAQRAQWRQYFAQILDGSEAEVEAAADGAVAAIGRRADQAGVVAAGHAAAAAYRQGGAAPVPPVATPPAPAAVAPPAPLGATTPTGANTGVVTAFQQRQELDGRLYIQVLNFRVERRDANGQPLPPVPVEIRGRSIRGQINNGDVVEVPTTPHPARIRNITTGSVLEAKGRPRPVARAIVSVVILVVFAFWILFILHLADVI